MPTSNPWKHPMLLDIDKIQLDQMLVISLAYDYNTNK